MTYSDPAVLSNTKFRIRFEIIVMKRLRLSQDIEEFKKGKVEYRADKTGIVHLPFGKSDFSEDLLVNLLAAAKSVETNKPSGAKGVYWKSVLDNVSMGPHN
ncbi:hypothetical protein HYC85_011222 [Camellia sinensis]|uniref:Uncharacterized protein n=1 Tax=Camellia sinensis TaxID=4442 RepID=A0A7J7HMR5_CAMSI|nr:hypothetical protein HYC85_011222 [Camellia sinensis]